MADIVGAVATSYDLPNYVGELFFQKSERPNTFLRLIGGLAGAIRLVKHWEFAMSVNYELPAPAQPSIVEGADPALREEDTTQDSNVLQIFQQGVGLTYSRESSQDAIGGVAVIPGGSNGEMVRPGSFEWQVERTVERIQNEMNFSFLRGAYQKPANNATARQTRGVRTAVVTNDSNLAAAALTKTNVNSSLKTFMTNRMFQRGAELYCLGNADAIDKLINVFEADAKAPESRTVAGVQLWSLVTRWATLNIAEEPDLAAGELFVTQPQRIKPTAMPVVADGQNKGILFRESLAHTGAQRKQQVYGEWGVDYGNEIFHGVIRNFT